jgi:hypothetical protein
MAGSHDPRAHRRTYTPRRTAASTPGSLGRLDHGDPGARSCFGDTPGPLGLNDYAQEVSQYQASIPLKRRQELRLMLLDRKRVAAFLSSVLYMKLTAEAPGLSEQAKNQRLIELLPAYMTDFSEACSRGGSDAMQFLIEADNDRNEASEKLKRLQAQELESSRKTAERLGIVVKGLKTVEYGAGAALTVMGLFVGATGALAAGLIGFAYDTATGAIDDVRDKGKGHVNADVVAIVSADTAKSAAKDAFKEWLHGKFAGKELEEIEKLEEKAAYLEEKIGVKLRLIADTKSARNARKLTKAMAKDEGKLLEAEKSIARFQIVNYLFAASDVKEKAEKIWDAWHESD